MGRVNILKLPKAKIYIDGANMFYAQQKMGWFIDWRKTIDWFKRKYQIMAVQYYIGVKKGDTRAQKFNNRLKKYGFEVKTKPLKKIYLSKDKYIYKANFDVEIAIDLVIEKEKYDNAILFSGDSDFEYAVAKLHSFGKKVIVCCSRRALSKELTKAADRCFLLGDLRGEIEYK